MSESGERIGVLCSCGKTLKAPANAVGKRAKCPTCGAVLKVQAPPPPPPPPPAPHDSVDDLYDLADQGEQLTRQAPPVFRACPQCTAEMAAGAVLCTTCGYDTRTGKSLHRQAVGAPPRAKSKNKGAPVDKMAPQASFFKGLAGCVGGALIGGIVWFLIAWGTGYELYFIALLVGALAGMGMQWGQQGYSYLGGFAAAAVTLVVMILAKIAVVAAVLLPVMRAEDGADGDGEYDERVVDMLAEEHLKSRSIDPDEASLDQYEAAERAAEKKLAKMPKDEYQSLLKKVEDQETHDELVDYVTDDVLKRTMKVDPDEASESQHAVAEKRAERMVAAMTPAQRKAELKRLTARAEAQAQKELEEMEEEAGAEGGDAAGGDGDKPNRSARAARAIGFVVILLLLFGWKSIIFMLGALFIAYRTASGSVHG